MLDTEGALLDEIMSQADEAGFIPLMVFSRKLLKRTPNEINTFFDPDSRFYEEYQRTVVCNIRHNVTIKKTYTSTGILRKQVTTGGIYKDDLLTFLIQALKKIDENNQLFDQACINYWSSKKK
ncbi:hypothetical protein [Citrobacter arsenatis]|uniref:hypothetical protein n=1 Tax=Citrobacter arsenatis TaxID=2546350 RepID=UPI00300E3522